MGTLYILITLHFNFHFALLLAILPVYTIFFSTPNTRKVWYTQYYTQTRTIDVVVRGFAYFRYLSTKAPSNIYGLYLLLNSRYNIVVSMQKKYPKLYIKRTNSKFI